MEVHKHPHNVTHKKKWGEYLLEFFMIFFAVFLGFLAENIREHFSEKETAKQYARSLIHDLEKDTMMVQVDIKQMKGIISTVDSVASFLRNKSIGDLNNRTLYYYTRFECDYRPYTWSRATLDQIKSSGSLRYFGNDSIIMRISAYDAFTKHLDEDFNGDNERNDKVSAKRDNIVNLNYPFELSERVPGDSIPFLNNASKSKTDLPLLTTNMNEIRSLVNDYLVIKNNYKVRGEGELPRLIDDASQLISMLKNEYHLK
jgi:hypothetical protein